MDKRVKSTFCFEGYKVDSIKFDINSDFNASEVELKFGINVTIKTHPECYEGLVILHVKLFENAIEKNYPFELHVTITGEFSADDKNMSLEDFRNCLELNGTTAMFPFLRSVVADITRSANVEPLILPLMNIHKLIAERKAKAGNMEKSECGS